LKRSKRYIEVSKKVDKNTAYSLDEAIALVKETSNAKFDETLEASFRLGVDPRKQDQMVRGSVVLPHGTGKTVKVLVFTRGEEEKEAKENGADYVGFKDLIEKIKGGWLDFDYVVATPDTMAEVAKLGRILGARGLMPSPKTGTVTKDIGRVVNELKRGRINFKVDKTGNVHVPLGKLSFSNEQLMENFLAFFNELLSARPSNLKGTYIKSVYISSTMGPSVKLDLAKAVEVLSASK